jgi:hypothetical protein
MHNALLLGRDRRILALGVELSHKIVEGARTISFFPSILKRYVTHLHS